MAAWVTTRTTELAPTPGELESRLRDTGLQPRVFRNAPGDRYDWHAHERHKILFCAEGAITFHTQTEDFLLEPGDRIDIEPGTTHAAHVHAEGVTCVEAYAPGPETRR